MPNRIIKETIWDSPSLRALSPLAERFFYRLLPLPDDHGCFQATTLVVKGRCFPLESEISTSKLHEWYFEMQEAKILKFWKVEDRLYGVFINWAEHQRIRSLHNRKTPEPPTGDDGWCQLTSSDRPVLNLNPNPNPKVLSSKSGYRTKKGRILKGQKLGWFKRFWIAFDYKSGKADAADAWLDIVALDEVLVEKIVSAAEKQAFIRDEETKKGKTPKMAQGWLTSKRWDDETLSAIVPDQQRSSKIICGVGLCSKEIEGPEKYCSECQAVLDEANCKTYEEYLKKKQGGSI